MPAPLPIDDVLPELTAAMAAHPTVVLSAPAGSGKTTRAPARILDSGLIGDKQIIVMQPRRVAARAVARRIAWERGQFIGDEIGYQVRFDRAARAETRLLVASEGVVLRKLHDDPFLDSVGALVFDEFHERSLNSDLALAMALRVQQSLRPDLRIVVMSATLNREEISRLLGGCPVIEGAGRAFPVVVEHVRKLDRGPLAIAAAEGASQLLHRTDGHVLVFLPGKHEIRQTARRLQESASQGGFKLSELHGDLPAERQDEVLAPSAQRKVILATNIAETSLTIEGVTGVVDSGLARVLRMDSRTGLNRLELSPISQASAEQRAGRAGRTAPGVCLRLWPLASHRMRPQYETPEVHRVELSEAVLRILTWEDPDLETFPWIDRPAPGAVDRALALLERLGALQEGDVTPLGRRLARLPMHPRLARLLLEGCRLGIPRTAALAAASLSEREALAGRRVPLLGIGHCDLGERLGAWMALDQRKGQLSRGKYANSTPEHWKYVFLVRDQLLREIRAEEAGRREPAYPDKRLSRALLAAFPDRVARRRGPADDRALMVGGTGVRLAADSVVRQAELIVCLDVDASGGEAVVRQASAVERSWLPADSLRSATELFFDETHERVACRRRTYYLDLLLDESPAAIGDVRQAEQLLTQAAADRWPKAFPQDDPSVRSLVERIRWLREWLPELDLPAIDDEQLRTLLPMLATGRRSFAEMQQAPWTEAIAGLLSPQQAHALGREAPEQIQIPSGSRIRLQYEAGKPPVLAVRIQELFGMSETPRLAKGRAPVVLHLLAPNMRPEQITSDLASFWRNTYPQVRKDLRGRYPKHSWPLDPTTATPERGARRRG